MPVACDLYQPVPDLFIWQYYDPAIKADLCSSAIVASGKTYLIDPVLLEATQLDRFRRKAPPAGVVVTNANHQRAALYYSKELSVPVFAQPESFRGKKPSRFVEIVNGTKICDELEVIGIKGAVAGEIALYRPSNDGALVVGDALINFEPPGFALLPRKYCLNQKQMRRSLQELLSRQAKRMFFAHGAPILSGANPRLQRLLDIGS
jgi:glyoxylase-like metal-dependent hydrolase (beta-lactamase superfamily II)